jgi:hypothetical protein
LGSASPKITRAFAGRFRTAVAQSVGAACLFAGTFGSHIRHIPAGGFALAGMLSDGRGRSCPWTGKATNVPIRALPSASRIQISREAVTDRR